MAARTPERRAGTALQLQVPTQPSEGRGKVLLWELKRARDSYSRQQRHLILRWRVFNRMYEDNKLGQAGMARYLPPPHAELLAAELELTVPGATQPRGLWLL